MRVSVIDAESQLNHLVQRAEAGDEVILTRQGKAAVRLVPVATAPVSTPSRKRIIDEVRASARRHRTEDESAARSQDFLCDKLGLPKCPSSIPRH